MNFSGMNPFESQFDDDEDPLMDNSSSSSSSSNHNNPPKEQNVSFSQPAPTTNKLKKPDEDVIVIEDDEEPSKPTEENKQDAVSDSDSVQIISLEQYKANIEAKKQETSKRLVHILNEDESREVCMNNYKNQMGLELLKKLGKKKKKVLNRNEVYDPVSKSIRKADREFEELMEKELNPTNYAESPFEIEKKKREEQEREYQLLQKKKNSILKEREKFLGFSLGEDSNYKNPPSLPPNTFKRPNPPTNPIKTPNHPPKSYNHANTFAGHHRNTSPTKEIKRVDLRDIREKVMKDLVDADQDNAKYLKYFFAESKKYWKTPLQDRKDYELTKIPSGKDVDMDAFYSAGVYFFKNLIYELLEASDANDGIIALVNDRDKWRKKEYKKFTHNHHHHHKEESSTMLHKKRVNH